MDDEERLDEYWEESMQIVETKTCAYCGARWRIDEMSELYEDYYVCPECAYLLN